MVQIIPARLTAVHRQPEYRFPTCFFDDDSLLNPTPAAKKKLAPVTRKVLDDIFDLHNYPYVNDLTFNLESSSIYDDSLTYYRNLWESKKVDLIVTQLTNIADRLKNENISIVFVTNHKVYLLN